MLGCQHFGLARLCCIQQLLWRGLLHPSTEAATIAALTVTLQQATACLSARGSSVGFSFFNPGRKAAPGGASSPAVHGMDQLLGTCTLQVVAAITGGLPWVLLRRHDPDCHAQVLNLRSPWATLSQTHGSSTTALQRVACACS